MKNEKYEWDAGDGGINSHWTDQIKWVFVIFLVSVLLLLVFMINSTYLEG